MAEAPGICLTEQHFRDLVAGKEIEITLDLPHRRKGGTPRVRIILADIGWDRMFVSLGDAGAFEGTTWDHIYGKDAP